MNLALLSLIPTKAASQTGHANQDRSYGQEEIFQAQDDRNAELPSDLHVEEHR